MLIASHRISLRIFSPALLVKVACALVAMQLVLLANVDAQPAKKKVAMKRDSVAPVVVVDQSAPKPILGVRVIRDTAPAQPMKLSAIQIFLPDTNTPSQEDYVIRLDTVNPVNYGVRLFKGCPSEGAPETKDKIAAALRNRDLVPPRLSYNTYTIDDINQQNPDDALEMGTRPRKEWTKEALTSIGSSEQRGATVQGYLLAAEVAPAEECNCNSESERDIKLWLTARSGEDKMLSFVSVLTPRLLARHPAWREISRYQGQLLRVSGWLYWNGAEAKVLTNDRGSLWEIHPIMKLEALDDSGNWQEIK